MKCLFILLACIQLSVQLPQSDFSSFSVSRSHTYSPYTSNLERYIYRAPRDLVRRQAKTEGTASILDNVHLKFLVPITVGTQTLHATLDTGSSATWLIQTGFECYNTYDLSTNEFVGLDIPKSCNFAQTYSPDDDFHTVSGAYLLNCYGQSGEGTVRCVNGPIGTTSVTLAGLKIPKQVVGAPDRSSYPAVGLPEQSGIIGLAFPGLGHAYNSTTGLRVPLNPIMETIFDVDTFTPPLAKQFSMAISRDASNSGDGGVFTIGGVPDLTHPAVNVSSKTPTSAPLKLYPSYSTTEYTFYSIVVGGFVHGQTTTGAGVQVIVDSGTNGLELPPATAEAINALWSPAMADGGGLACDAVLTKRVGITIGGATYYIRAVDLIGETDGKCYSLVTARTDGQFVLGDPLLRNVLAVFDWEDRVISFYPRMYYKS